MKQITIILLLLTGSLLAFSQTKFQAGVFTEGAWFLPKGSPTLENGYALGGGLYTSYPLGKIVAVSVGAGYRYKTNQQVYIRPIDSDDWGYPDYGYDQITEEFPQHYIVVPLKFQFSLTRFLFLETGIEGTWLLNYDIVNEKPEYNWLFGAGYQISPKLVASLCYSQGIKDQGFGDLLAPNEVLVAEVYKNRMLMLNLSYSIFSIKN